MNTSALKTFARAGKFKKELLEQMAERRGQSHYGEEREETDEQKAEGIVSNELRRLGLAGA